MEVSVGVPLDADTAYLFCMLIESAARVRLTPTPAWPHDRVAGWFAQGMQFTPHHGLSLGRVLALSAAHLGRNEDAARYFREAIRVTESAGAKPELARSLLDQAEWLAPAPQALELAQRAGSAFRALGLDALAERARQLALACGATGLEAPAADSGRLSAAELALLRQLAYGRDYSAIARELLLTPDRVAALTQALFAKTGSAGRAMATAYAFAHGFMGSRAEAGAGLDVLMVTSLEDFNGFEQRLGALHARTVMHLHNQIIRRALCAHGGREVAHTGDGFMAGFREAREALACAIAVQRRLEAYTAEHPDAPLRVRIGLNAGQPFGAALTGAVRICTSARAGSVLMSESVHSRVAASDRQGSTEGQPLYEIALERGQAWDI
jgi:class 3 adenylate cyclase